MPVRRQAINWTNVDPIHWYIYAALARWVNESSKDLIEQTDWKYNSDISHLSFNIQLSLSFMQNDDWVPSIIGKNILSKHCRTKGE